MACIVETKVGSPILAETAHAGDYGAGYYGYIGGYNQECKLSYTGTTLKYGSGQLLINGKYFIIDGDGLQKQMDPEPGANKTYNVFIKLDMATGVGTPEVNEADNPPGFVQDDLFLNYTDGVHWVIMGTVENSSSGIVGVANTLKRMQDPDLLWEGDAAQGDTINLKQSIYRYRQMAVQVSPGTVNDIISCPIITGLGTNSFRPNNLYPHPDHQDVRNASIGFDTTGKVATIGKVAVMQHNSGANHAAWTDLHIVKIWGAL